MAYHIVLKHGKAGASEQEVDAAAEQLMLSQLDKAIDFEADDALRKVEAYGLRICLRDPWGCRLLLLELFTLLMRMASTSLCLFQMPSTYCNRKA